MFYIRADCNKFISVGHIMRCLSIANELNERGRKVCFLIADETPIRFLKENNISYINLHSDWRDLMTDAEKVRAIILKDEDPGLLVDSYSITKEYVEELKPFCKLTYLGSKSEYLGSLDSLINYSFDVDYDFYHRNYDSNTTLLLGPLYAPLRKEFQNVEHTYKSSVEHILITTGNTDRDHMIPSLIEDLLPVLGNDGIHLDIVIGTLFDNKEDLHYCYGKNPRIILHENVQSMSLVMKDCDLAISASGTTVYELSATGIPIVSFAMVEEQVMSAEALFALGVVDYCGRSYEDKHACIRRIIDRIKYYLVDNNSMIDLAKRAHRLIDGNGCKRIVDAIL